MTPKNTYEGNQEQDTGDNGEIKKPAASAPVKESNDLEAQIEGYRKLNRDQAENFGIFVYEKSI